jgi:hypothetical protein
MPEISSIPEHFALRTMHGTYLSISPSASGGVTADKNECRAWEMFDCTWIPMNEAADASRGPHGTVSFKLDSCPAASLNCRFCDRRLHTDTVALGRRSHHGTYIVCSAGDQPGQGYRLSANPAGGYHIFQVELLDGGQYAFKGRNGMYMSASPGSVKQEPHRLEWELFTHEITPNGLSSFLSAHDMYLSVSPPKPFGILSQVGIRHAPPLTQKETRGRVVFLVNDARRIHPNDAMLYSSTPFVNITTLRQASRLDEWEKLRLQAAGNGRFRLVSAHGDLLTAQPSDLPCPPFYS